MKLKAPEAAVLTGPSNGGSGRRNVTHEDLTSADSPTELQIVAVPPSTSHPETITSHLHPIKSIQKAGA